MNHNLKYKTFIRAVNNSKSFTLVEYDARGGLYSVVFKYKAKNGHNLLCQVQLKEGVNNSFYFYVYDLTIKHHYWNNVAITIKWFNVKGIKSLIDSRLK